MLKQESVKSLLEILPQIPDPNLLFICENASQVNAWYREKQFCTDLHHLLINYFTGQAPPKLSNRDYQDILEAEADKWLSLYNLLFFGWNLIEMESDRIGIDLEGMGIDSPGSAFKFILYHQSNHAIFQSKSSHSEFSPRKGYYRCDQSTELLTNLDLSSNEKRAIVNDKKYQQKGITINPGLCAFYGFCLRIFVENKNNQRIKKYCDAYISDLVTVITITKRLLHPKNKMKGFATINGERRPLRQAP